MKKVSALFLFCEGPHDVAFCRLVFKYFFRLKTVQKKFSEYPAPLNKIFPKNMEKHVARDLTLNMAHKFFLPDLSLTDDNNTNLVVLFNIGGKTKLDNPRQFLADFLVLYDQKEIFVENSESILEDLKYIFFFDADHETKEKICFSCKEALGEIDGVDFIGEDFVLSEKYSQAAVSSNKAVYILGDLSTGKGTLEDILLPIYQESETEWLEKSRSFIHDCFDWKTEEGSNQNIIAERAKQAKAIITSAGQRKRPGRPMSAIIQDDVLGSEQQFLDSEPVKKLADFIADFSNLEKD